MPKAFDGTGGRLSNKGDSARVRDQWILAAAAWAVALVAVLVIWAPLVSWVRSADGGVIRGQSLTVAIGAAAALLIVAGGVVAVLLERRGIHGWAVWAPAPMLLLWLRAPVVVSQAVGGMDQGGLPRLGVLVVAVAAALAGASVGHAVESGRVARRAREVNRLSEPIAGGEWLRRRLAWVAGNGWLVFWSVALVAIVLAYAWAFPREILGEAQITPGRYSTDEVWLYWEGFENGVLTATVDPDTPIDSYTYTVRSGPRTSFVLDDRSVDATTFAIAAIGNDPWDTTFSVGEDGLLLEVQSTTD